MPSDAPSNTPITSAPARTSEAATASCNGPVPESSTRRPGSTRWRLTRDWTAPAVNTPGSVQPGKGIGRSEAPGARMSTWAIREDGAPGPRSASSQPAPLEVAERAPNEGIVDDACRTRCLQLGEQGARQQSDAMNGRRSEKPKEVGRSTALPARDTRQEPRRRRRPAGQRWRRADLPVLRPR